MKLRRGASSLASLVFLGAAGPLAAQVGAPMGAEFQVNTYTTEFQRYPTVASDSSGNFVVVWQSSAQDGSHHGLFAQRYASSGAPAGTEFRVNTYTTDNRRFSEVASSVASDPSGNFVVVWTTYAQDGSGYGVFGQRYASSGAPAGDEFRVNTYTTSNQRLRSGATSVASDSSGNFVVVWASSNQDGSGADVFGQRYESSGAPTGTEFRVNTYTTAAQGGPSVASDPSGNFVVVWTSRSQDGSDYGAFGQRYASSGAPAGAEFRVNAYTTGFQGLPNVASDSSGNFVVVWTSYRQDGSLSGVFGQRYASSGALAGTEFRVNSYTTATQVIPQVASDPSGNVIVVWESYTQDGSSFGVFGQRYASSGALAGTEFRVNSQTSDSQNAASVASDSSGNFLVVWASNWADGSLAGIVGQRYGKISENPPNLSLSQGRVQVTVGWQSQYSGESGSAFAVPQQDSFGYFYFTDPDNPEVFVKVLDFGDGRARCYVGGLTDFYYKVTFQSLATGKTLVFEKPAGAYVGFIDNGTLGFVRAKTPGVSSKASSGDAAATFAGFLPIGEAVRPAGTGRAAQAPDPRMSPTGPQSLTLSQGRVQVAVEWRSQYSGASGTALAIPQQDAWGAFYFTDPSNPEVFVKVLDFGGGGALCFVGGLSDFYYKVTFKTLRTGQTLVFEKPAGLYVGFADNGALRF